MTEKKLYTCDICRTDYKDKENALKCEKDHCISTAIKDFRYSAHGKYPHGIEVKFADGSTHWYKG